MIQQAHPIHAADMYTGSIPSATIDHLSPTETAVQYLPGVIDPPNPAAQMASTLPLRSEPYTHPWGQLPPFLAGLLPEGQRLSALRHHMKISVDNELGLLLPGGGDPVGDVFVLPPGETPSLRVVTGSPDLDFDELAEQAHLDPGFLAGVQPKVSHHMLALPSVHLEPPVLAKLPSPEFPDLVRNEHALIMAATKALRPLGIPVVDARLETDRHGRLGLLVTRFDRIVDGDRLLPIAVEDGTQVLNLYPASKYEPTTEELILALSRTTTAPPIATRTLFAQVTWAFLTGNGDAHAKNFSILGRGAQRTIAPAYDLPCTLVFGDDSMALSIAGQVKKLRRRHFLELASSINLPQRVAESIIDHLRTAAANIPALVADLYPDSRGRGAARELRDRAYRLGRN